MKNTIPLFEISLAFMKPEISAIFFSDTVKFFQDFFSNSICICCEEEGEIVIPTETGFFNIEDYAKTYVVNGEPTRPTSSKTSAELSSPCNSLGIPLSYQRTASLRTNLNPPPGQMSSK